MLRQCCSCEEEKPVEAFYKDAQRPDGIALRCKVCRSTAYGKYVGRWKDAHASIALPTERLCKRCGKMLPISAFSKDSHTPLGVSFYCRPCKHQTGTISRERVKADPARRAQRNRQARLRPYRLSPEQYDALEKAQGGKCAICKDTPEEGLHIDHCHHSNTIRGLLCPNCNMAIGLLRDSPDICARAAHYLSR